MATEQEFLDKLKGALASGKITKEEAKVAITKFKELSPQPVEAVAPQTEPKEERSFLQKAGDMSSAISDQINRSVQGVGETALSIGGSMLAEPVSGIAGIMAAIPGGRTPAQAVQETQEAFTYQPRTQAGQQAMGELGETFQAVANKVNPIAAGTVASLYDAIPFTGERATDVLETLPQQGMTGDIGSLVADKTGSPFLATVASTLPVAIAEIAGFKGTRAAKIAKLEEAVKTSGVSSVMTPEAIAVLKKQGIKEAEIARITGVPEEQVERLARFQSQGVQPTAADITQNSGQRMQENQLLNLSEGDAGSDMRAVKAQQSTALQSNFSDLVDAYGTGIAEDTGNAIKEAVESRRAIVKADARDAYNSLANAQGGADNIPLLVAPFDKIPDMPNAREIRSIKRVDSANYKALQESLAEFGLSTDEGAIAALAKDGVMPEQLNIQNFEEFRQSLNVIRKADESGNLSSLLTPIINEVDRQIDIATDTLMTSGNPDIAALAKDARSAWRSYLIEFDPKSLAEDLTKNKPRSTIPFTEVSQVYDKVSAKGVPVEQVNRLLTSLKEGGAQGNRAIAQLQSNVVADLMDSMFTGTSNQIDGVPMVSGAALNKRFYDPKFNAKIQAIFKDSPDSYRQLEELAKTAEDITTSSLEMVKGSGGTILDVLNRAGFSSLLNMPAVGPIVKQLDQLSANSKNRAAFSKAVKARPDLELAANDLVRSFPMLSAALGIGYLSGLEEEE